MHLHVLTRCLKKLFREDFRWSIENMCNINKLKSSIFHRNMALRASSDSYLYKENFFNFTNTSYRGILLKESEFLY